jgi:hypothetical protein
LVWLGYKIGLAFEWHSKENKRNDCNSLSILIRNELLNNETLYLQMNSWNKIGLSLSSPITKLKVKLKVCVNKTSIESKKLLFEQKIG